MSFRGKIGGWGFILIASSFSTASSADSFLTGEDQIRFHHRHFLPVKSRGVGLSNVAYLGVELSCTLQKFDLPGSHRGNPRVATTEPLPLLIVNCYPVEVVAGGVRNGSEIVMVPTVGLHVLSSARGRNHGGEENSTVDRAGISESVKTADYLSVVRESGIVWGPRFLSCRGRVMRPIRSFAKLDPASPLR